MKHTVLHLDNEATTWENATPVGCGKLGAMLYGGVEREIIQLNEEKIWAERTNRIDPTEFCARLDTIRKLLHQGKNADAPAKELLAPYFGGVGSYETAGELHLDIFHSENAPTTDYRRDIDLTDGVASVAYTRGEVHHTRTAFASYPQQMLAYRLSADQHGAISLRAHYERQSEITVTAQGDTMTVQGKTACSKHTFTLKLRFVADGGTLTTDGKTMTITAADSVCIYVTAATDTEPPTPDAWSFDALLAEHIADFSPFMRRAGICYQSETDIDALPVPARLARLREGHDDPGLINLYFHFGRYLLLSSSRGSSLPANLQGVWNGDIHAPWGSDYHTNVNLQMNYWHAEVANLPECALPLFHYMNDYLLAPGQTVARDFYHCRGTVVHHLSDIYGFAAPADGLWGLWQLGGAWLCYAMWEHYLFSPDEDFLRRVAYPYIRECTRFFLDFMVEDESGTLTTGPSTSPENTYFVTEDGVRTAAHLCLSPTMDVAVVRGLLQMYIACEDVLGADAAQRREAAAALSKMPGYQIGARGQLMEWQQDYDEPEPGHRHISHAFPLYPGREINRDTPDLMNALRVTLRERLSHGGGHTGWSCAWLINLYARLYQGDDAADMIAKLFKNSTLDNLFDTHPPFQIDGNFGAAAAMAEMLLQSHTDTVDLLPALPSALAYQNGSFYGLRARGGITVDAAWRDGRVISCTLRAERDTVVKLRVGKKIIRVELAADEAKNLDFGK